jgi:hypothetical protein
MIGLLLGCLCVAYGGWRANDCFLEFTIGLRPIWVYLVDGLLAIAWIGLGIVIVIAAKEAQL